MKMTQKVVVICSILYLLMGGVLRGRVLAEGEGILPQFDLKASSTFSAYNKYVWRGITLDTDPVVQPGVDISGYGFTLSFWSSFDADSNDTLASDEVDFTVDYTHDFEYLSLSLGHTNYDFPAAALYSKEWYIGIAASKFFLSPALTFYNDYGREANGGGDGQYINIGISHSLALMESPAITLDLAAGLGFNNELFIRGEGGDFLITAGLGIPLTKNAILSPSFSYAAPLGDLKDSNDGNQKNRTYGGVSLAVDF
ncbi:MAG: hypothetical protein KKB82_00075 [Candidatus Omnitrophica bacterium]|nr:hypothetical protein [Candidatus Omnitrophota bacterium]MBU1924298.1 hypothetical protein [Candidatus Omnitrophota bacterium]